MIVNGTNFNLASPALPIRVVYEVDAADTAKSLKPSLYATAEAFFQKPVIRFQRPVLEN